MAENKTKPTPQSVAEFLARVEPPRRREQGLTLCDVFCQVTGWVPRMWGPSIVGYGVYDYTYKSGKTGTWMATGFSPRKSALSIYIMPGYQDYGALLDRLGPHKMGKSCLYITRLDAVDHDVLAELIRTGLADLAKMWPVRAE
jgi:hypothetical protein